MRFIVKSHISHVFVLFYTYGLKIMSIKKHKKEENAMSTILSINGNCVTKFISNVVGLFTGRTQEKIQNWGKMKYI